MDVAVVGAGRGIDHRARGAGPLHATRQAATCRIGGGGVLQNRMRRVVGQIEEHRFVGFVGLKVIGDPLFGACCEEVGGVAEVEVGADLVVVFINFFAIFLRVVAMPIAVAHVTVEEIEAAIEGVRFPVRGSSAPLQSPFTKGSCFITGNVKHAGEGVIITECFVELIVPHRCVALMHAVQQGRTGRRTNWSGSVVAVELHTTGGHGVELRGGMLWLIRAATVLKEHSKVPVTEVVTNDEDNIRPVRSIFRQRND